MTRAFVALGSNLDHPAKQIRAAFAALAALSDTRVLQVSSLYRTAPVGFLDQPDFINAVAELDTMLAPRVLLQGLLEIESDFGRARSFPNAPRTLDLDLLWYQGESSTDTQLTLPHPRMHQRAFVLVPLSEIAPDLVLESGRVLSLLGALDCAGVERLPD
jgi:2-amino-4-hydroxy-6-hydroxymethyldihydropteridine diphosphokinase